MMIILLIVGIIGSVAFPKFQSFIKNRKTEYFLNTLEKELMMTQQKAINETSVYRLTFNNEKEIYQIGTYGSNKVLKREIPKHITVEGQALEMAIQFNQNGNISRAGTIYIHSDDDVYKMVFQIGKGKFYVTKQ
ncbi:competence type IV pilus minor pilin ComGD [Fictibacillus phosphorivorans]|uniref:competence type IV pilus minor pilin ComGD n=1 Tax=Fictibacillus phosphorivorans TaxID=1221500 RepID=UPI00255A05E2|nr:competence type IV pilus minor pilin ComGD [Fictibacillus phosphorivorans]